MADIARTMARVRKARPVFAPIFDAFEPLLSARESLTPELAAILREGGITLPAYGAAVAAKGEPLLAALPARGFAPAIHAAAAKLLPLLYAQETVAQWKPELETFFLAAPAAKGDARDALLEAMTAKSGKDMAAIAERARLPAQVLDFAAGFIVSAVLRALARQARPAAGEAPWDKDASWRQGYCPVCGGAPSIGWLDRPSHDEKNAFLSGGGGKKHLHCALCGSSWKFRRGACPACGKEGEGVVEVLTEEGDRAGRIDLCSKCRHYCPTVDLREIDIIPNMDVMALGLMHLDMVAAERKLKPMQPSFWNTF